VSGGTRLNTIFIAICTMRGSRALIICPKFPAVTLVEMPGRAQSAITEARRFRDFRA
jgi:hypothetical protein